MLKRIFPFLSWITNYDRSKLNSDLVAGLTVGIMLIPQGMAYAMIAGMPPIYGLYAALVPQLVYALMGTSRQLAVGPVAMDSLLVAAGVGALNLINKEDYITTVLFLTLLIGGLQLLMGIFKMGFFVNFLSKPVISGFTSAAALLIGFGQLNHILGTNFAQSGRIHELLANIFRSLPYIHWPTFVMGLGSILFIVLLNRFNKKLPVPRSIFIGLDGSFAPWVGALVADVKQPILLVTPEGREEETITRLSRVGFDHTLGFLKDGIEAWKAAGKETDTVDSINAGIVAF